MADPNHLLGSLAVVLVVAAATTVLCHKLRQPVVLGYILAGLIIGPHVPVPLVADAELVHTLSEMGVILLMFSIGLEFNLRKLARLGLPAGLTAVVEVGLMVSLGYVLGGLFGWHDHERLFLGAALGISSTMLVAKAFAEQKITGGFTEIVFAVLVFEDLLAIVMLAVLTPVASGVGLAPGAFAAMAAKLAAFLGAILLVGLLVVPRVVRLVVRLDRAEILLVASVGICFAMAHVAQLAGYSVALGAFLGGMLVSESGKGPRVEHAIQPFRDVFAAIFFVAVGMTIDPALLPRHWVPIVVITVVVVAGKVTAVTLGAFLSGNGLRRSVRAGMSLGQIGEFSFIIAGLAVSHGAARPFLLPIAAAVSCLTALATPWLIRASERAAGAVDARLPRRLQTFVTFYESWIEGLRSAPERDTLWTRVRRPTWMLLVDAVLLVVTAVGGRALAPGLVRFLAAELGLGRPVVRIAVIAALSTVAAIFLFGILRCAMRLGRTLAAEALPASAPGEVDLGNAPRRALAVTLTVGIILVVGLPLAAIIQPFVRAGGLVLLTVVAVAAVVEWRSITNLQGHVRAGSELIVEAIARQNRRTTGVVHLDHVRTLLPGIPGMLPLRVVPGSPAIGRSLATLNLRALTGASVLAITRGEQGSVLPSPGEVLREGDVLALAGAKEAIDAARALLLGDSGGEAVPRAR